MGERGRKREGERERRERDREENEREREYRERENITSFLTGISEINPLQSIIRSI